MAAALTQLCQQVAQLCGFLSHNGQDYIWKYLITNWFSTDLVNRTGTASVSVVGYIYAPLPKTQTHL